MNPMLSKAANVFVKRLASLSYIAISLQLPVSLSGQQAVTGIVTDYNSFWKTSASSINPVKPNNSHNLLAFTVNGVQYSTGVNNLILDNHGETYVEGDFWSLPLANYSGSINSNTKVGLGEMYDGVHNGKGKTPYPNSIAPYLNDGIKGLDIGTCVANIPAGTISFLVNNIKPENIGDGMPDIIVTQVADPSGSADKYSFVDAGGVVIGQTKSVTFSSIAAVANWTADFYEASSNPMTLTSGYTNTDRPIRLWAADLSDFGITEANFASVKNFRIALSGNSDVAFVAYNNRTMKIVTVLPVELTGFTVRESNKIGLLNWSTSNEKDIDCFVVEKSLDGTKFTTIDTIKAKGTNTTLQDYTARDERPESGTNYYRLKIIDMEKRVSYSRTIQLNIADEAGVQVIANPSSGRIIVIHPSSGIANICIYNGTGILMQRKKAAGSNTQTGFDVSSYAKGIYHLVIESRQGKTTRSVWVR